MAALLAVFHFNLAKLNVLLMDVSEEQCAVVYSSSLSLLASCAISVHLTDDIFSC